RPGGYTPHGLHGGPPAAGNHTRPTVRAGARGVGGPPDAMSSPAGHLLLFGLLPERPAAELPPSAATDETEGWHLLRRPTELAFPLHTLAARAWFEGRYV
ncbi:NUDIX hydrolase, partial [Streptomyces mirabilis]|uniref:DNA mismatch repair protein MutT n=1 Tax=Streptomyces mirabilis TaxID=68239 RepID=UPI0036DB9224